MRWCASHRADPPTRQLADRHYNRQKIGSPQFVPPGRCCVLLERTGKAFWVTSWPFAEYVKHEWPGAWVCSAFRSEDAGNSIELVKQAIAATRVHLGEPPELGMITFIDSRKVKPVMIRGVPSFGWMWVKAGFRYVGKPRSMFTAATKPRHVIDFAAFRAALAKEQEARAAMAALRVAFGVAG